mgnify:CR=1 FL=1
MNGIEYVVVVFGIMLLVIGFIANRWWKKNRR